MYDLIIIGAGPAGISASLYAKRSNLNVLVLYYGESSLEQASQIENYYGFTEGISGKELYSNGIKQAKNLGVEFKEIEVLGIENLGNHFNVKTVEKTIETRTLILATGNKKIKPNISGINEFEGKGISYCAICDAFFYRNKNVAVIGNGKFAVNEARELSHIANNVTILTNGLEKPECDFEINKSKIKAIIGETKVNKVEFEDGNNLEIDGIFIALGEAGASDFAKTLGIIQNGENIKVNEEMETNVEGIYACGNITGGLLQISKAVYEGAKARNFCCKFCKKTQIDNNRNKIKNIKKGIVSKMKEIVAATNNKGKIEEFYEILKNFKILTLKEIDCNIEVEEDQETFEGNSRKKAEEISKATNMPCIADDSGLCIEAFNGWPGVYTARFLDNASQEQKNQAILEKMKNLKKDQRKAKFVCVVTYYENGKCISARGEVEGRIALEPKGTNGFGYDPIFELENGKTYAELSAEEKNSLSHRKRALENLQKQLTI